MRILQYRRITRHLAIGLLVVVIGWALYLALHSLSDSPLDRVVSGKFHLSRGIPGLPDRAGVFRLSRSETVTLLKCFGRSSDKLRISLPEMIETFLVAEYADGTTQSFGISASLVFWREDSGSGRYHPLSPEFQKHLARILDGKGEGGEPQRDSP
jgi:hypothetical protein